MSTGRPGLVATPGPSARPPRPGRAGLGRAMRIVDAGPRYFSRSALASLAVTCLLAIPIVLHVRPPGPLSGSQRATITAALRVWPRLSSSRWRGSAGRPAGEPPAATVG